MVHQFKVHQPVRSDDRDVLVRALDEEPLQLSRAAGLQDLRRRHAGRPPGAGRDGRQHQGQPDLRQVWRRGVSADRQTRDVVGEDSLGAAGQAGFDDFGDARLDIPVLRSLYDTLEENAKRNSAYLLASVERPNGAGLSRALTYSLFQAEETSPFTYGDEIAGAIETAAKGVWADHYTATRDMFERMGLAPSTGGAAP